MDQPQQLIGPRQDNGMLPEVDYAHIDLTKGGQYVDAGVIVEANAEKYAAANIVIPAIEYAGEAPDLGAYETDFLLCDATMPKESTILPGQPTAITQHLASSNQQALTVRQTRDGLYIVAMQGAKAADRFNLSVYAADGRLVGHRTFSAATVVALPNVKGQLIFTVSGTTGTVAKKIMVRE